MKTWIPEQVKTGWQQEDGGWRFYLKDGSGKYVPMTGTKTEIYGTGLTVLE